MRILVLGGTGAIGQHLVKLLADEEHQVMVTSRNRDGEEGFVRYINGNAHELDFLRELLTKSWDVIIDFLNYPTESFYKRFRLILNSTNQYIFLSSARVYADCEDRITEKSKRLLDTCNDYDYLNTDEYALAKAKQENLLLKSGSLNWTIIRPYITYSSHRLQLGFYEKEVWLHRIMNGKSIILPEEMMEKWTTLTHGLDVAKGIKALVGNKKSYGEIFNITHSEATTWSEILKIYRSTLLEEGIRFNVKFCTLRDILRVYPAKYQILYDRIYNRKFDSNKLMTLSNWRPEYDPERGLSTCIKSFLKSPTFHRIGWTLEARLDRMTGDITSIWEINSLKSKIGYMLYRTGIL